MELTLESLAQRLETLERRVTELTVASQRRGTGEDEQPNDPESIARWLAEFDAIPPLQMTPNEEAAWQASRATRKQLDDDAFERFSASLPKATR